jgi:hypothetical protein
MGRCYLHVAIATGSGDVKRLQLNISFLESLFQAGYEKIVFVEDHLGRGWPELPRGAQCQVACGLSAAEAIGQRIRGHHDTATDNASQ